MEQQQSLTNTFRCDNHRHTLHPMDIFYERVSNQGTWEYYAGTRTMPYPPSIIPGTQCRSTLFHTICLYFHLFTFSLTDLSAKTFSCEVPTHSLSCISMFRPLFYLKRIVLAFPDIMWLREVYPLSRHENGVDDKNGWFNKLFFHLVSKFLNYLQHD